MQADLVRGLLLTLVLSMAPSLAQAEDADLVRCLNASTGSEQKQCTQALFQGTAEELKTTYAVALEKAASSSGDDSAAIAIAESQRAWEIYRDAECKGVVGRGGGSGRAIWIFGCLTEKTRERIRELNTPFYQR